MFRRTVQSFPDLSLPSVWLPWWYRPSVFLFGASIPALVIFSLSDPAHSLSKAQLFYGNRDLVVGIIGLLMMIIGARIGESGAIFALYRSIFRNYGPVRNPTIPRPRLGEAMLPMAFDWILMGVFVVSHLIFFRNFFLHPGLIAQVLGGDVGLKHEMKTIPGVTTWTQVSLVLASVRGLRWAGILPGRVKLISLFHLTFFGILFVRSILWSERLALVEGVIPFFVCAFPRVANTLPRRWRPSIRLIPLIVPVLLLFTFTAFESLRSWQAYSSEHSSVLEFGWRRLFSYYFEAMNTGAATLGTSGFYDHPTRPMSFGAYDALFEGLYQGEVLDEEYNNPSGLWYVATLSGNLLFVPVFMAWGWFYGVTWKSFTEGRMFGLFYPMNFIGLMEVIRIPYWGGLNRALPSTVIILLLMLWAATLASRLRVTSPRGHAAPPRRPSHPSSSEHPRLPGP